MGTVQLVVLVVRVEERRDCCVLQGKWAVEICYLFPYSAARFIAFVLETQSNYSGP